MQDRLCPNCFQPLDENTKFCPNCGFSGKSNQDKYPVALPAGTILAGRYIVGRVLGQGGFGITYLAQDYQTKEKVALKEYFPETMVTRTDSLTVSSYAGDREENFNYGKDCFLEEAKTLAEFIGNDNIVRVYSYFEENGTAYFAMEFIEGESLQDYLTRKGGRISFDDAKRILFPVMDALAAVHAKGIVHRDISPDNIYLCKDNTIRLLDFGAARYSLGDKSRSLDVVLKHGYAPKEQYTRRGRQGPYTDVYSIAATFYRAITGQIPPDSIDRIDTDELRSPSALGVSIPQKAEEALLKALSVQPEKRFQNVAALKNAMTIGAASAPSTVGGPGITFFEKPSNTVQSGTNPSYTPTSGQNPTVGGYRPPQTTGQTVGTPSYPTSGQNPTVGGYRQAPGVNQTVAGANPTVAGSNPTVAGPTPPSQTPKKSKKWLIPVIIGGSVLLSVLLILIPVLTCAGSSRKVTPVITPTTTTITTPTVSNVPSVALYSGDWDIDVYAANTDENDDETLLTTVGTDADYFHVDFYVYDGDENNPITVSYQLTSGSQTSEKSTWEDIVPDDTLTVYWENGFSSPGTLTVTLFNESDGGTKMCDFSFEIVEGATPASGSGSSGSSGTGSVITGNDATIHVGDTWKVDGVFSITINSFTETSQRNQSETKTPAAVYIIDYDYTNIGYTNEYLDGLYFSFTMGTKDAAGEYVDYYYLDGISESPDFIEVGKTIHCVQVISVSQMGTVTSVQDQYVGDTLYKANFILEP